MSADRYVHSLLNSTYRIYDEGNGTLQLEAYGSPSGTVITALEDRGDYYHVITAYDAKKKKGKLIWSGRNQVVSNQQNAIGSKVQAGQTAISTTLGSSDKPTPLKRNTGILNQNPALGVLGTNEYGIDNTTPLSTVNDISAELSNDVSTKRLLANGKLNVVQSVDDLPAMIADQVKRSVAPSYDDYESLTNVFLNYAESNGATQFKSSDSKNIADIASTVSNVSVSVIDNGGVVHFYKDGNKLLVF